MVLVSVCVRLVVTVDKMKFRNLDLNVTRVINNRIMPHPADSHVVKLYRRNTDQIPRVALSPLGWLLAARYPLPSQRYPKLVARHFCCFLTVVTSPG